MCNRFSEMTCFVLAGGEVNRGKHFESDGDLTYLEKGYRRYAAVFERVELVLKEDQAREKYLNFPHVTDSDPEYSVIHGVEAALRNAATEAVFIGSSEIRDFPLHLAVELVRQYKGEDFLGYRVSSEDNPDHQPLFGIYSRKLMPKLAKAMANGKETLREVMAGEGRLLDLPADIPPSSIGLNPA